MNASRKNVALVVGIFQRDANPASTPMLSIIRTRRVVSRPDDWSQWKLMKIVMFLH